MTVLAIFPDAGPMWRHAAAQLDHALGKRIRCAHDEAEAEPLIGEAEVVLAFALSPALSSAAHRLRWIQAMGSGLDGLRHAVTSERRLTRMHGVHGPAVSEAALGMMLALARNLPRHVADQAVRVWRPAPARLLSGATLGIVGTGAIAQALATRAGPFGMRIVGFSATPRAIAGFDAVLPRVDLAAHVGVLDHLVLLAPLSDETHRLVDASLLAAMKPTAYLINVGRGGLIDEVALIAALAEDVIAGAALDVFGTEPLPADSPLWSLSNVLITPHVAGRHAGYVDDVVRAFLANLDAYDGGRPLANQV